MKKNYVSSNLKYLIRQKGMTQTAFSKEIGWANATLNKYTNGRTEPSADQLMALSEYFNITIDNLVKVDIEKEGITLSSNKEGGKVDARVVKHLLDKIDNLMGDDSVTAEQISNALEVAKKDYPELGKEFDKGMKQNKHN